MSCDVGKATEGLENELWCSSAHSPCFQSLHLCHSSFWFSKLSVTLPTSQLILKPFPRFTYITAHSPTLPSLYLRHNSFSNLSVASPTSQLILQPFFRFSYITGFSLASPGEPPMCDMQFIWILFLLRSFFLRTTKADLEDHRWSVDHSLRSTAIGQLIIKIVGRHTLKLHYYLNYLNKHFRKLLPHPWLIFRLLVRSLCCHLFYNSTSWKLVYTEPTF